MFRVCPRDNVELTTTKFMNEVLDACPQCDGVWFNKGELENVLGLKGEWTPGRPTSDEQGTAECPDCHVSMASLFFREGESVVVDRCSQCEGVWLDAQELNTLVKVTAGDRAATPPQ